MLQEHSFTSFFPKSPPGFMVAKIRNFFPAVNSSTSLSLSSRLPFSANTRDFSTSRTLEEKLENMKLYKAEIFFHLCGLQSSFEGKEEFISSDELLL